MTQKPVKNESYSVLLGITILAFASPALGAPALFSGTLTVSGCYLAFVPPHGGGLPFTSTLDHGFGNRGSQARSLRLDRERHGEGWA